MRNFFRAEGAGAPSRGVRRIGSAGGGRKGAAGGGKAMAQNAEGRRRFFGPVWEYLFFKGVNFHSKRAGGYGRVGAHPCAKGDFLSSGGVKYPAVEGIRLWNCRTGRKR